MFVPTRWSYREIIPGLPDLKENEIYILHVGDGEYNFNVFGAVYNDLLKLWQAIKEKYPDEDIKQFIVSLENKSRYFISIDIYNDIACISIEKVNPENFPDPGR